MSGKPARAKGDGAIYHDADAGRWVGQLDLGRDPESGKRRRRKVTGRTKSEVAKKLDQLRRERANGVDVGRQAPTVAEVVEWWLGNGAPGPKGDKQASTMARLTRRIEDHLLPGVGHLRVDQLRPEDVERWLRREALTGQTHRTLLDYRGDLRQVLNWAKRRRLVTWNAAAEADLPEGRSNAEKVVLNRAELERLAAALTADRMGPYFVLLVETGLRPGEADALAWSEVDLEAGELFVERSIKRDDGGAPLGIGAPKTAKSRRGIELTAVAVEALRRRRAQQATERLAAGPAWSRDERWAGLVFTTEVGTPIHPSNARRSLTAACKRAEVPIVTPYGLRHTATTILAEDEPDMLAIAHQLGHVDTRMVERVYRHRPKVVRTAADAARRRATEVS